MYIINKVNIKNILYIIWWQKLIIKNGVFLPRFRFIEFYYSASTASSTTSSVASSVFSSLATASPSATSSP